MVLICKTLNPLHPRMLVPKLVIISPVILEKKILKRCQCSFAILNYLPLKKDVTLPLNKLETQDVVCQVWLKLTHWFWRSRFLNFVNLCKNLPLVKKKGGLI